MDKLDLNADSLSESMYEDYTGENPGPSPGPGDDSIILTQDDEDTCDIDDTINEVGNNDKFYRSPFIKKFGDNFPLTINNKTVNYENISKLLFTKLLTDTDLLTEHGFYKIRTYYKNPNTQKSMDFVCRTYSVHKGDVDFIQVNEQYATTTTQVNGAYTHYLHEIRKATIDIGRFSKVDMDFDIYPQVTKASIYESNEKGSREDKTTAI
jgi:phage-related protein